MSVPQVIIMGRCERREFAEPYRQCTSVLAEIGAQCCANSTSTDGPTDFVIFFQSYPHEFPQSDLARLRRQNPFAPFLFVLGVCCEGMLRTAGPLDSPFYRYVHAWNGTEPEQIRRFLTEQPSLFSLPLTAEQDEIAQLSRYSGARAGGSRHPLLRVLILTHFGPFGNDSAMNRLLADEYASRGYEPLFTLPETFSGKIVADADDSPPEKIFKTIQSLRRRFADNDFTVYVNSPRFDEKNGYIQAGVTRVLPKIR